MDFSHFWLRHRLLLVNTGEVFFAEFGTFKCRWFLISCEETVAQEFLGFSLVVHKSSKCGGNTRANSWATLHKCEKLPVVASANCHKHWKTRENLHDRCRSSRGHVGVSQMRIIWCFCIVCRHPLDTSGAAVLPYSGCCYAASCAIATPPNSVHPRMMSLLWYMCTPCPPPKKKKKKEACAELFA